MLFFYLLCVAAGIFYLYVRKRNNYWNERNVITVKSNFIAGHLFDYFRGTRSFKEIYNDLYKSHPHAKYVGTFEFFNPKLFIKDPDLIHQILVKHCKHFQRRDSPFTGGGRLTHGIVDLGGDQWRTVRKKLTPFFSPQQLKLIYETIEECANLVIDSHLRPCAEAGEPVDMKELISIYSVDVIGCCAYGLQLDTINDPNSLFQKIRKYMFAKTLSNVFRRILQLYNPNLLKWFCMKTAPEVVERFFFDLLRETEKSRKTEQSRRHDLMQLMLDIKDEEQDKNDSLFTENHVASNMFVFYNAGHETTSKTLALCFFELAANVEIQEKLIDEIRTTRAKNEGKLDFNGINDLTYLDIVVSEVLRKHAVSSAVERVCTATYKVPGSSLVLQPGDTVICPIAALHHDANYYPNPEKFDPERFSKENKAKINPSTYIPFGDGPRICIAVRFAILLMKCYLVAALTKYKFFPCNKTETSVGYSKKTKLRTPFFNVWLTAKKIENN